MDFPSETYHTEGVELYFNCVYIPWLFWRHMQLKFDHCIAELKQPFNFSGCIHPSLHTHEWQ